MKKIVVVLMMLLMMVGLCACGGTDTHTSEKNSQEKEESSLKSMSTEIVEAGQYRFVVPDNGDTKFADGETMQNFYFENGDTGVVWYSIDGPLSIPKNEDAAHNITSSLGKIVEFKYSEKNGFEQAIILNKCEGEYQGVRLVSNTKDENDCIWLSVTGTDEKIIKSILDSLEW